MTDENQPLDRRIFGSLKARTRARFARHVMSADEEVTMSASIGILLDAWRCDGDEQVHKVWAPLTSVKSFVSQFLPGVGHTCCRSRVPLTLNSSESRLTWISGHPCES
jgi:hypothetical protein